MSSLELVTIIVDDYDEAITFFVDVLGFSLTDDRPSLTNDGQLKRWVVVTPADGGTGLLLAKAANSDQRDAVGNQVAGRVGFFLRVKDFDETLERLRTAGAPIHGEPRIEPYGSVVVFSDIAGNRWDLLGPAPVI